MRWLTLLVLLLATVAIHSDDEVETDEASETEATEEKEAVDDWEDDGVMILTAENFEEYIEENEFVLVEFYAPWCGHCKSFAPDYAKIATELEEKSSPIKVVKVDATKDPKYTEKYGVRGYPTLKLFRNGSHTDFWGQKIVGNIIGWLNKKTGPAATDIENVESAEKFIKSKDVVIIGFFDDYESDDAKAFIAAADAIDDYPSGITKNPDVYKKYEAKSGSFILFKNFDEGKATFDGEFTQNEIQKFVAIQAAPLIIDFHRNLALSVFSVIRSHVIFFISKEDGHWEEYVKPAEQAAKHFKGKILFIAIDSDVEDHQQILDFFNIKDEAVPTFRLSHFVNDANRKYKPMDNDLSPEGIISFVQDGLDGKLKVELKSETLPEDWDKAPVKTLVATNFDDVALDTTKDVFVVFYSPWSDDSKKLAPIIDELGEKYKDSETIVIAKFDALSNELDPAHQKVVTYPTLRLYKKGDNDVEYYVGKQTVDAFAKFIESGGEEITPEDVKKSEDESKVSDEQGDKSEDAEDAEEDDYNFEDDSDVKDEL